MRNRPHPAPPLPPPSPSPPTLALAPAPAPALYAAWGETPRYGYSYGLLRLHKIDRRSNADSPRVVLVGAARSSHSISSFSRR